MDRYLEHAVKCLEGKMEEAQKDGFCIMTVAEIDIYLNIIKEFENESKQLC